MKIINTKQNSKDWLEWRGKGLGASDAPAVMGDSPWSSILELWLDKTGLFKKDEPNGFAIAAMRRGTELEPKARVLFENKIEDPFPAISAEHDEFPFIRASFDGFNADRNEILEIKCPGKIDHDKALQGKVPDKYIAQIQQQLMVSGADRCHYYSWDGKDSSAHLVVKPNYEFQARLLGELISFYDCITKRILPTVTQSDIIKIVNQMQIKLNNVSDALLVLRILAQGIVPEGDEQLTKRGLINVK